MKKSYITRVIDKELDELLPQLPAVVLEGPKGTGKTETATNNNFNAVGTLAIQCAISSVGCYSN